MKIEKVLYFEGAGMDFDKDAAKQSNVGNYRIGTVFRNLNGIELYIEMGRGVRHGSKVKLVSEWAL